MAACLSALARYGVAYELAGPIVSDPPRGARQTVSVSAIGAVALHPPLSARCDTAEALAAWVTRVVVPLADLYLDRSVTEVAVDRGYECRRRRGGADRHWSEHAFANAIDVAEIIFADGSSLAIGSPRSSGERLYQSGIRKGACAHFTTVLGPRVSASDAGRHLHLDLARRRGGYQVCE